MPNPTTTSAFGTMSVVGHDGSTDIGTEYCGLGVIHSKGTAQVRGPGTPGGRASLVKQRTSRHRLFRVVGAHSDGAGSGKPIVRVRRPTRAPARAGPALPSLRNLTSKQIPRYLPSLDVPCLIFFKYDESFSILFNYEEYLKSQGKAHTFVSMSIEIRQPDVGKIKLTPCF